MTVCLFCESPPVQHLEVRGFQIVRCEACDHEWVDPLPTPEQVDAVYNSGYFTGEGLGYRDYFVRQRASNQRKARYRLDLLGRLNQAPSGRILDIGAADGSFVAEATARNWDAYGVEVSREARAALAEDLRPRVYESLDEAAARGPFQIVTLWDVLEHLPDITDTMTRVSAMLAPGGLVGIVVPVIDNWNARKRPHSWDQYKPPEHLTYFSTRSLRRFAQTRIGPIVHEEPAWIRHARRTHPDLSAGSKHSSLVVWAETHMAKSAAAIGLVDASRFLDSQLVVCQKPSH